MYAYPSLRGGRPARGSGCLQPFEVAEFVDGLVCEVQSYWLGDPHSGAPCPVLRPAQNAYQLSVIPLGGWWQSAITPGQANPNITYGCRTHLLALRVYI